MPEIPRIIVAIELANGARPQAVCRTQGCTAGKDGQPWKGEPQVVKVAAETDARHHRQWHRAQRPVPVETAPEEGR
ncbi:hypothetical protein Ssi03_62190 [Sphaerisporangium siamense]|uniref:Uncharacterized protein n=1 Tax=Sphaerisporangium siamense TaxID=795645 RepID=A0A7W7DAS5_9ACTN|nr:hypothetical protein [Sphaerisporangium siamense]MBB4702530.1 hypothetical protein [Sphaerisporangium siamense]GII88229.1 hypothetical protein Ssi03_62190 [Sphaerisporangium siamense]